MESHTFFAGQDLRTKWRIIADTVAILIEGNSGKIGVPDIVSPVAQYTHFFAGSDSTRHMLNAWLDERVHLDHRFVVFARIPQRQTVTKPLRSSGVFVGGQEEPWPAFSIFVSDELVALQLLDSRVSNRFASFCNVLERELSAQTA